MTSATTPTDTAPATTASKPETPALSEGERDRLDGAIRDLGNGARTWSALTVAQRVTLLRAVRSGVAATAEDWANTAAASKGLDAKHPSGGRSG